MSVTTDNAANETQQQPLFELYGKVDPDGHGDAVMPVRWCVSSALRQQLRDREITKPYVLLIVRPYRLIGSGSSARKKYQGESLRKLVPLTDIMAYVSFSRPGLNEVTACLVYNSIGKGAHELGGLFLSGSPYHYNVELFTWEGDLAPGDKVRSYGRGRFYSGKVMANACDSIDVDVPSEMFAKEYSQAVKALVSKFELTGAADQCGMRKRVGASLFISLFYFPLAYLARIVQLIFGSWFGLRGMELRGFRHPIDQHFTDVLDRTTTSVWFKRKDRTSRALFLLPLNPVTPVISGLLLWGVGTYHVTRNERIVGLIGWDWWQYFAFTALVHVATTVVVLVLLLVFALVSGLIGTSISKTLSRRWSNFLSTHKTKTAREREAADQRRKEERQKALDDELAAMLCSAASRSVSLDALPKEKRTVKLRYHEAKTRVCKPLVK